MPAPCPHLWLPTVFILAVGNLGLPGTQHHCIGAMLQALRERRKVWNLKGGGYASHRSRKPSLTAVFVYVGVQWELGPSASPKHWIPRKVKGAPYVTVKTLSTKWYDVWDRGICFKRTGRCERERQKKHTGQGNGLSPNIEAELRAHEALFKLVYVHLQFGD